MGKTMNEIGKTLFPNLTEERRQQIIADFGNEEINYLSQKGAILYEGLEETFKILSLDYNDKGYVCSLYLYVKIELDMEWLYEKIYGFA